MVRARFAVQIHRAAPGLRAGSADRKRARRARTGIARNRAVARDQLGFDPSLATGQPITTAIFAVVSLGIAYWGDQAYRSRQAATRTTRELLATTEDLRAREAHLHSILQTVPDAMIVINEQGIIQSFSSAAERLFGYAAHEVIGSNVSG